MLYVHILYEHPENTRGQTISHKVVNSKVLLHRV